MRPLPLLIFGRADSCCYCFDRNTMKVFRGSNPDTGTDAKLKRVEIKVLGELIDASPDSISAEPGRISELRQKLNDADEEIITTP